MNVSTQEPQSPLEARFDAVIAARRGEGHVTSDKAWSLHAGLSEGYVKQQRFRARADHGYRLPEDGAEALAKAADVRVEWLRFGTGPMSARLAGDAQATVPQYTPVPYSSLMRDVGEWKREVYLTDERAAGLKDALRWAFDPSDHSIDDIEAVRALVMTPDLFLFEPSKVELRSIARVWLDAAAHIRENTYPMTPATFAFAVAALTASSRARAETYRQRLLNLNAELEEMREVLAVGLVEPDTLYETCVQAHALARDADYQFFELDLNPPDHVVHRPRPRPSTAQLSLFGDGTVGTKPTTTSSGQTQFAVIQKTPGTSEPTFSIVDEKVIVSQKEETTYDVKSPTGKPPTLADYTHVIHKVAEEWGSPERKTSSGNPATPIAHPKTVAPTDRETFETPERSASPTPASKKPSVHILRTSQPKKNP